MQNLQKNVFPTWIARKRASFFREAIQTVFSRKILEAVRLIPIETLHLVAGYGLIVSGLLAFSVHGLEMALSWAIFGSMYISMSDVGENEMSQEKLRSRKHVLRRIFGYAGALLTLCLVLYYLSMILSL